MNTENPATGEGNANAEADSHAVKMKPRVSKLNRRRGDLSDGGAPQPWLVSFTDIMALMLTFFVLLYAMSEPEEKSFSKVMAALQQEFHVYNGPIEAAGPEDVVNLSRVNFNRALPLDYLNALLERLMNEAELSEDNLSFYIHERALVISMPEDALFESGGTELKESSVRQFYKLGNALSKIRNRIEIVGHSDPRPITNPNSEYASNWELSLERASVVGSILRRRGYTQPMVIKGNSNARFADMGADVTQDLKEKYARRVDIRIMQDDGNRTLEQRLRLE